MTIKNATQGYSTNAGVTAVWTVTAGPTIARSILAVFADTDEHGFYISDGVNFELIWGRFDAPNMIAVLGLTNSSNGDAPVVWGAGEKLVIAVALAENYLTQADRDLLSAVAPLPAAMAALGNSATRNVGTTPGTVAAGDDPRLTTMDAEGLAPATVVVGIEGLMGIQEGLLKGFTPEILLPDPVTRAHGYLRSRLQQYSKFTNAPLDFTTSIDGAMFGNEPVRCRIAGTGVVSRYANTTPPVANLYWSGGAVCKVPLGSNSLAGVEMAAMPIYINPGVAGFRARMHGGIRGVPLNTGAENAAFVFGLVNGSQWPVSEGLFLYYDDSFAVSSTIAGNWQCISRAAGHADIIHDTGVQVAQLTAATPHAYEVRYDPAVGVVQFYIDENDATGVGGHALTTFPVAPPADATALRCAAFVAAATGNSTKDHYMCINHMSIQSNNESETFGRFLR